MKTLSAIAIATLFVLNTAAVRAEDAAVKPNATRATATAPVPAASPVKVSQQDKMRQCSKDAKGKKGAERKDFMKTCLSKKA
jgi:hypothetical protein